MKASCLAVLMACLAASAPALGASAPALGALPRETTWFPGAARELSLSRSASRDAPVTGIAFGPRLELGLGLELGVVRFPFGSGSVVLGGSALVQAEGTHDGSPTLRGAVWRDLQTLSAAFVRTHGDERAPTVVEIALALGHEGAHAQDGRTPIDPYRTSDIPFGAGGWFFAPDAALSLPVGGRVRFIARIGERFYFNVFPALVGEREASNYVADMLGEGLLHAPWAELGVRWRWTDRMAPSAALSGQALVAHDDVAKDGFRLRLLCGVALPGRAGELTPFVAGELGNGVGLLVNRRELRLAVGVRLAAF